VRIVTELWADRWREIGQLEEGSGSLSSQEADGRQVYVFGFQDGKPGVWKSESGVDIEVGADRLLVTSGLIPLSDLQEPYVLELLRFDRVLRVRIRVES
jgi:hypothetical protein